MGLNAVCYMWLLSEMPLGSPLTCRAGQVKVCGAFKRTGEGDATEAEAISQLANTSTSRLRIQSKMNTNVLEIVWGKFIQLYLIVVQELKPMFLRVNTFWGLI